MGRKKLSKIEKAQTFTKIKINVPVTKSLPEGTVPKRKIDGGAPAHQTKLVKKWLSEKNIPTLEWPGNSPDLNSIENAWNVMKIRYKKPSQLTSQN